MKNLSQKPTRVKLFAMTFSLFILLTICTKSASSQTLSDIVNYNDFSGEYSSTSPDGTYYNWKLSGDWLGNGLYVRDKWEPQGLYGELSFQYIYRVGTTAGIQTIKNYNANGYGTLFGGEHTVYVTCTEETNLTFPIPYTYTSGYEGSHTYVVTVLYN